jgi:hypothetical protein
LGGRGKQISAFEASLVYTEKPCLEEKRKGKEREGKGREGKGREGKGREEKKKRKINSGMTKEQTATFWSSY